MAWEIDNTKTGDKKRVIQNQYLQKVGDNTTNYVFCPSCGNELPVRGIYAELSTRSPGQIKDIVVTSESGSLQCDKCEEKVFTRQEKGLRGDLRTVSYTKRKIGRRLIPKTTKKKMLFGFRSVGPVSE